MSATQFTIANGETKYIEVPVRNGTIGCHLSWFDATSSATVTLELTSYPQAAPTVAGSAWEWKDSGLTFTGPAAAAAGALQINVENARQKRARLKLVGAAASSFELLGGFE